MGYNYIALTEHGNVSSHFQLEKAAVKLGITPIYGLEAYCGPVGEEPCPECDATGKIVRDRMIPAEEDVQEILAYNEATLGGEEWTEVADCPSCKGSGTKDRRSQFKHHLTVLAGNVSGYRNLNRVVTESYRQFYYHPTVSGSSLVDAAAGLYILSGCSGSHLACALLGGKGTPEHIDEPDIAGALDVIERYLSVFGEQYFLEVQPFWELPRTHAMNVSYEKLSKITGVPLVVTHDVHYPRPEDAHIQAMLHAIHRGAATVDDQLRSWNYDVLLTLPESDEELLAKLEKTGLSAGAAKAAIATSGDIASCLSVTLPKAARLRYRIGEGDLQPWKRPAVTDS